MAAGAAGLDWGWLTQGDVLTACAFATPRGDGLRRADVAGRLETACRREPHGGASRRWRLRFAWEAAAARPRVRRVRCPRSGRFGPSIRHGWYRVVTTPFCAARDG